MNGSSERAGPTVPLGSNRENETSHPLLGSAPAATRCTGIPSAETIPAVHVAASGSALALRLRRPRALG